jgi:hypothetical protein
MGDTTTNVLFEFSPDRQRSGSVYLALLLGRISESDAKIGNYKHRSILIITSRGLKLHEYQQHSDRGESCRITDGNPRIRKSGSNNGKVLKAIAFLEAACAVTECCHRRSGFKISTLNI